MYTKKSQHLSLVDKACDLAETKRLTLKEQDIQTWREPSPKSVEIAIAKLINSANVKAGSNKQIGNLKKNQCCAVIAHRLKLLCASVRTSVYTSVYTS